MQALGRVKRALRFSRSPFFVVLSAVFLEGFSLSASLEFKGGLPGRAVWIPFGGEHLNDPRKGGPTTRSCSSFGTTVRGDIRTVGMSGALVGLAGAFIASTLNLAGIAMVFKEADAGEAIRATFSTLTIEFQARPQASL